MAATYTLSEPGATLADARVVYTITVSFPDPNNEGATLTFDQNVMLPGDETLDTAAQAYADDYETGYAAATGDN